ncbi:DUF3054 family protein [Nocardia puris]|uniref:DUF3054 family protein n=1 Tax=Nocardia puris TaxID=208602 RepID=A0A366DNF4_9NOCA|nr:DUF3054 family protein [Nocardia puris]
MGGRPVPTTLARVKRLWPLAVDVVLVILFCAIGRRSHDEAVLAGLAKTAWPFLIGLGIGWGAAYALTSRNGDRFDGTTLWPTGILVWACTLVGGMLLRAVSGQGTAASFLLVAGTVLALFLLGWRAAVKALD